MHQQELVGFIFYSIMWLSNNCVHSFVVASDICFHFFSHFKGYNIHETKPYLEFFIPNLHWVWFFTKIYEFQSLFQVVMHRKGSRKIHAKQKHVWLVMQRIAIDTGNVAVIINRNYMIVPMAWFSPARTNIFWQRDVIIHGVPITARANN